MINLDYKVRKINNIISNNDIKFEIKSNTIDLMNGNNNIIFNLNNNNYNNYNKYIYNYLMEQLKMKQELIQDPMKCHKLLEYIEYNYIIKEGKKGFNEIYEDINRDKIRNNEIFNKSEYIKAKDMYDNIIINNVVNTTIFELNVFKYVNDKENIKNFLLKISENDIENENDNEIIESIYEIINISNEYYYMNRYMNCSFNQYNSFSTSNSPFYTCNILLNTISLITINKLNKEEIMDIFDEIVSAINCLGIKINNYIELKDKLEELVDELEINKNDKIEIREKIIKLLSSMIHMAYNRIDEIKKMMDEI